MPMLPFPIADSPRHMRTSFGREMTTPMMTMRTSNQAPTATPSAQLLPQALGITPLPETLMLQILGNFTDMPGLSLYPKQASRLFGEPEATCSHALDLLVASGHLRRCPDGQYRAAF